MTTMHVSGVTVSTPKGGRLTIPSDKPATVPGPVRTRTFGTAFGPLELTAYPGTRAVVGNLSFGTSDGLFDLESEWFGNDGDTSTGTGDGSGTGWFAAGLAASTTGAWQWLRGRDDAESVDSSRRDLLKAAGAGVALAGGASAVARGATKDKASFDLERNVGGLRIRVLDTTPDVLPADQPYVASVSGLPYARFAGGAASHGDVPPLVEGSVAVSDHVSILARLREIVGSKAVTYDDLGLQTTPTEATEGAELKITSHDMIVSHLQTSGPGDSTLSIGATSVPHYNEDAHSARGWYAVRDDTVVYRVGSDPPGGDTATLTLYTGVPDELADDAGRVV